MESKNPIRLISIFLETNGIRHNGTEAIYLISSISTIYILFKLIENHTSGIFIQHYVQGVMLGRVKDG